jgi:hypothetical protein
LQFDPLPLYGLTGRRTAFAPRLVWNAPMIALAFAYVVA